VPTEVIAAQQSAPAAPKGSGGRRRTATPIAAIVAVVLVGAAVFIGVRLFRDQPGQPNNGAQSGSVAPSSSGAGPAAPTIQLTSQVTDQSNVLNPAERAAVERAVKKAV
jgi:predicted permease